LAQDAAMEAVELGGRFCDTFFVPERQEGSFHLEVLVGGSVLPALSRLSRGAFFELPVVDLLPEGERLAEEAPGIEPFLALDFRGAQPVEAPGADRGWPLEAARRAGATPDGYTLLAATAGTRRAQSGRRGSR